MSRQANCASGLEELQKKKFPILNTEVNAVKQRISKINPDAIAMAHQKEIKMIFLQIAILLQKMNQRLRDQMASKPTKINHSFN